ncbi:MAG: DUF4411 family protein [Candidatus Caenarcaniphilales bacterium]|nr:DUF4411 family protein [Candidatus Caenarcaniphilales bacterium]
MINKEKPIYIFDTNIFIRWFRDYPEDVFQGLSENIKFLIEQESRVLSSSEVLAELEKRDDSVYKYAKRNKKIFIRPTVDEIHFVQNEVMNYSSKIDRNRRTYAEVNNIEVSNKILADPWVLALAKENKAILVTAETNNSPYGLKVICEHFKVVYLEMKDMFRSEGWKF